MMVVELLIRLYSDDLFVSTVAFGSAGIAIGFLHCVAYISV